MALQQEGVRLAVEGANKFISDMRGAGDALSQLHNQLQKPGGATAWADGVTKGGDKLSQFIANTKTQFAGMQGSLDNAKAGLGEIAGAGEEGALGIGTLGGAAMKAIGIVGGLSTGLIALAGAAVGAVVGIVKLGEGIVNLTKHAMELAEQTAPIQGIAFQFRTMTQEFEGGSGAMLTALTEASAGMIAQRDLMQRYNSAASLVNRQFAEQLPRALSILTKTSAATGKSMDYLFDSFVRGVGRTTPLVLDNLEIQAGLAESAAFATKMFGKQEDQLTETQKQMALAEYTLQKLEDTYGAFPDVVETAAAQTAIFNAHLQNIKDTLGQFLLPAFTAVKQGINAVVGAFSAAISEGGAFYPLLVNLGAVLSIVADGFRDLATRAADWLGNLETTWVDKVGGIVESAIRWGAEIVTNFAVGMIDAANTVLTWAMQQISNILTWWLAPGSPPKILPNLDKWGMAAFESYLQGMTSADFGILESIQGPLKKVLTGEAFADVSKLIAQGMATGDRAGILSALTASSKQFGDDIAELASREFALADATNAVTEAENALVAAQERAAMTSRKVNVEVANYNRMLREGATKSQLDAQLQRINAAEQERNAAIAEQQAAAEGIDTAKERVNTLKGAVDWQKDYIDQLFGIQDALTKTAEIEKKGEKGKAGKPTEIPQAVLPPAAGGIGGAIASAIEAAKDRLKASLGGIWDTIKTEFSEKWDAAIGELGKTWDKFVDIVGSAWDRLKTKYPFLQDIEDWIVALPEKITKMITTGWDKFKKAVEAVWNFINTYFMPILRDLKDIVLLALQSKLLDVQIAFRDWLGEVQGVWDWIKKTFLPFIETYVQPVLETLRVQYVEALAKGFEWVAGALQTAHEWLGTLIERIKQSNWDKIKFLMGDSPSPLAIGIQTAADAMERMARVSIPQFNAAMAYQPAGAGSFYRPSNVTNNTYGGAQFTFNTTPSNGLDVASLESLILRTVRRAMSPGAV